MAERKRAPRKRRQRASPELQSNSSASKKKEDIVARMRTRWDQAKKIREKWQRDYRTDELYSRILGTPNPLALDNNPIHINRFLPTIQTMLPSMFFSDPSFRIVPKERNPSGDIILQKTYAESVLKEIASREFNLQNAVSLALVQSFVSIGVIKIIYDPRSIPNPQKGDIIYETNPDGSLALDPRTNSPVPLVDPQTGEPTVEPDEIMSDEVYRFEWVNGDNMLLPDQGPDQSRWTWIGEEITVTLDEAKEDERFPKRYRDDFVANGRHRDDESIFQDNEHEGDDYFSYVEIWDIRKRRYYVLADGQPFSDSEFIVDSDYPDGVEEHPYAILPGFFPIIGPKQSSWPLPFTYNWLSQEDEYQIKRRQSIEGGKRTARKIGYDESTFADEDNARAALQSPVDMEAVKLQSVDRPWISIADADLPASIFQELTFMDRDWIRTTGQPGARVGGPRAGSATEAGFAESAGQLRDSAERQKINQWLSIAGQKMFQRVQATLTLGMWIKLRDFTDVEFQQFIARVYRPEVAEQLLRSPSFMETFKREFGNDRAYELTREDLEFQAKVLVVPGSSRLRTLESDREQFLQAAQLLGSFPSLMQSRLLLKLFLQLFEIDDEALIDELQASSQRQVEIEREKAGRNQGASPSEQQAAGNSGFQGSGLGALLGGG